MKKKTAQVETFIKDMHKFINNHPQFRKDTKNKTEKQIQTELRPIIISYLENYFQEVGYKDYVLKAHKSFYWEGQEGQYGKGRATTFGARNYPDYVIKTPYLLAVEYKQSPYGSTIKQGIGQSMMHTLCGDFDFVYYLFHDESEDERIKKSESNEIEKAIIKRMWIEFNVYIAFTKPRFQ